MLAIEIGAGKRFFFEKKKQKTFIRWSGWRRRREAMGKVFLVLFFQKKNRFPDASPSFPAIPEGQYSAGLV